MLFDVIAALLLKSMATTAQIAFSKSQVQAFARKRTGRPFFYSTDMTVAHKYTIDALEIASHVLYAGQHCK